MKKYMKVITVALAVLMAGSLSTAALAEETVSDLSISSQNYPLYYSSMEHYLTCDLYFLNDQMDIPYVNVEDITGFLNVSSQLYGDPAEFTMEAANGVFEIQSWNEFSAVIDCDNDEISFDDYNAFFTSPAANELIPIVGTWTDSEGQYRYLAQSNFSFERPGREIEIKLAEYNIELIHEEDLCLMPLQTLVDVFLTNYYIALLFNGEAVYAAVGSDGLPADLAEAYYGVEPGYRSDELAYFNYCELCLMLDMHYGLKEIHKIDYFGQLFSDTDLDYALLSNDPVEYTAAVKDLLYGYFGDLHSSMTEVSRYVGSNNDVDFDIESLTLTQDNLNDKLYNNARDTIYPDGVPYYEEVGNTAFITFDHFTENRKADYYTYGLPENQDEWDTRAIIIYANQMIKREDSPIENVVLDLSLNGGGVVNAAAFVASWFLGEFNMSSQDSYTGAEATNRYYADVDLDGRFTDDDCICNYNLYCLTSPYSFSCGNLVPCSFKSTGTVTLLGKHTGGGACIVQPVSTADGTLFNISGPKRLSIVNNGSFYDVDQGVDPDFHIANLTNFYNRSSLVDFISNLY